jgi:AcrR family transcriptional regulator
MARSPAPKKSVNKPLQKRSKATQRERLLTGIITAANRDGYAGANVSEVIAEAGVSRPTFYDYFAEKDDCFLAAVADVEERLLAQAQAAVETTEPEQAAAAAVSALVAFATAEPAMARFLMSETLAGGPASLDARDRCVVRLAKTVEEPLQTLPKDRSAPDLPAEMMFGAIFRLIGSRLRRGERALDSTLEDLLAWIESYDLPLGEHRWRAMKPHKTLSPSPYLPPGAPRAPAPLGPGRPRISEEAVAENQRLRIMFATAEVVQLHGVEAATVQQITRLAKVDGRVFYRLFADKQAAFSAIHELGFQYLMASAAAAFFAGASWPERVWEVVHVTSESVQRTPSIAHVGFVEAYAIGTRGIQRVEDSRIAFTIFLQEGYQYAEAEFKPSRTALEASITAVFEILYRTERASSAPKTTQLTGHMAYVCLAPFLGARSASDFVDGQLQHG